MESAHMPLRGADPANGLADAPRGDPAGSVSATCGTSRFHRARRPRARPTGGRRLAPRPTRAARAPARHDPRRAGRDVAALDTRGRHGLRCGDGGRFARRAGTPGAPTATGPTTAPPALTSHRASHRPLSRPRHRRAPAAATPPHRTHHGSPAGPHSPPLTPLTTTVAPPRRRVGRLVRGCSATQITPHPATVRRKMEVVSDRLHKLPLSNFEAASQEPQCNSPRSSCRWS